MTNEMKSFSPWMLLTDEIFRNQVSFTVGAYDTVIINILPTHFEITCIPDPQFDECEDCPIKETCSEVHEAIGTGVRQILIDFNYIKTKHSFTFVCQASGCKGGHPAQVLLSKDFPGCLLCETATKHFKLPPGSHLWNLTKKT